MAASERAKAMSGPDIGLGAFQRDFPNRGQIPIFKTGGLLSQRVRSVDVSAAATVEMA